ncbi:MULTISPECIES: type II toxin-antitoxin system PemK/MazF family toxin [unclassified Brevibacterium]|uniref:type II toxin-antitoxin system PemK/MazF family toxin n=1 Tax=unclassified Brevibacterium TaxID=2614124 RepID=UPI0010C7C142|nr:MULTISPECIES: type II toxin-antitoxin system PemK/MazF family toxin [unclassified Brevibacterium]MCK1803730.1 type II toxin-antitoxin system PemK/MazF family toxin [Brevibacterium sp. R8603A2]QCP05935.1 type II toxin-antitoxin system PemK/MazF family toxin [Brevibacterium sp. CS2]
MNFKNLARRAVNAGVRSGVRYATRKLRDPAARNALGGLLGGREPAQVLEEYRDRPDGRTRSTGARAGTKRSGSAANPPAPAGPRDGFDRAKPAPRSRPRQRFPQRPAGGYPGDHTGPIRPVYAPDLDGDADPGEVVWGWVPYEEDHTQGKDRPVLIIGHEGRWLLGLMLTSKDNVPGGVGEVRSDGRSRWINIGSGDWDSQGRPSEVRLDRVIRIDDHAVRREGAIMPMELFSRVVSEVRAGT